MDWEKNTCKSPDRVYPEYIFKKTLKVQQLKKNHPIKKMNKGFGPFTKVDTQTVC